MNAGTEQVSLFAHDGCAGKTSQGYSAAGRPRGRTSASSSRRSSELKAVPLMSLDLTPGHGNLLGESYWEMVSPWLGGSSILNTGPAPLKEENVYSLSQILQADPPRKYYLSKTACLGILRRARERGKELPPQLKAALMAQAGLIEPDEGQSMDIQAYHINQRNEGIDLGGISGALMRTQNMQMQMFVTQVPVAFAANQRDEVRDLHDVAGALGAQPGMKQQTFVVQDCLTPWDTQRARIFTPESKAPALTGADGGGGRNPAGLLFTAGFCAGAAPTAGGIGYQEETAPTLKAAESGTNMVPSILCLTDHGGRRMDLTTDLTPTLRAQMGGHQPLICLNDQGGSMMECSEDVTGTLRAREHGHQPLVLSALKEESTDEKRAVVIELFENHGVDARYTGPHKVSPTLTNRSGTGGNNLPLALQAQETICISGNTIDRLPQNGGNGLGYQEGVAYTLTMTDHHAVFSRQRVDIFKDSGAASAESARQHKDATDLVHQPACQETADALDSSGCKGPNNQYTDQDKLMGGPLLIRRLTPLECERLQGFPDFWTDLPGASDSARYRALGNSVAIPCVEYLMRGIALALRAGI